MNNSQDICYTIPRPLVDYFIIIFLPTQFLWFGEFIHEIIAEFYKPTNKLEIYENIFSVPDSYTSYLEVLSLCTSLTIVTFVLISEQIYSKSPNLHVF